MNHKNGLTCFLLGVIVTLLVVLVHQSALPPAQAQGGSAGASTLFGIGGLNADGTGSGVLWVIDPENKQVACYAADSGRSIRFVGARKIYYDLKLKQINDRSDKAYSVDQLAKEWQKLNEGKKGEGKPGGK